MVRYVNASAAPGGDGLSWATAYDTFDQALMDATSGDQIWVAAGTYVGNFTLALGVEHYGGFAGTETELSQRDWTANPTILDGNQTGSVVTGPVGATATTRIDGFTITNGSASGLYLDNSSPTIANNTITRNSAYERGAGLYLRHSSATIMNNTITENSASYDSVGGGLYLWRSSPTIANNTITGNSAKWSGGGLYLWESSASVANNTITRNVAVDGGGLSLANSSPTIANNRIASNRAAYGGAMSLGSSSPMIVNNTITANVAYVGGGLWLHMSSPTIANNTITGNSATTSGGAMYFETDSSPTIVNTIIAFNSSGIDADGGTPVFRNNCIYGNTAHNYDGVSDPTGTNDNISADPRLADRAYGNVHIQPDSPCVDAGNNTDSTGDLDIDGEPRIQTGTVDIGADETNGTIWSPGPYVTVRVKPDGDDANDGSSWVFAKRTVQAAIDAAAAVGGEVWVEAGTYEECITLHPFAYVYGGFRGDEVTRDERNWIAHVTTLDGQQRGSVVSARAGHGVSAIDGFTVFIVFRISNVIVTRAATASRTPRRRTGVCVASGRRAACCCGV